MPTLNSTPHYRGSKQELGAFSGFERASPTAWQTKIAMVFDATSSVRKRNEVEFLMNRIVAGAIGCNAHQCSAADHQSPQKSPEVSAGV